jgi:hypothetical protein
MHAQALIDRFGSPDVTAGGLHLWIHRRQFLAAKDFGDGN